MLGNSWKLLKHHGQGPTPGIPQCWIIWPGTLDDRFLFEVRNGVDGPTYGHQQHVTICLPLNQYIAYLSDESTGSWRNETPARPHRVVIGSEDTICLY